MLLSTKGKKQNYERGESGAPLWPIAAIALALSGSAMAQTLSADNPDVGPKVVNGTETAVGARTYQVAIERSGQQGCGGTLVASQWVLTAGHCTSGLSTSNTKIRVGSHYRNSGGSLYNVDQIINHPSWSGSVEYGNDLALIHLTSPVSSGIEIAKLPTTQIESQIAGVGANVVVSGWGTTRFQGSPSSVLLEAPLPVMSTSSCQQELGSTITDKVVCGAGTGGRSACNGDSGGPYVAYQGSQAYSIGTVSWGKNCSGATAFTRTSSYKSWIEGYTGGTDPDPDPGEVVVLQNGVGASASGASQSQKYYKLTVPAGATNLKFTIAGGSGDADLYVKAGSKPTTSSYDCRPYLNGNNETCNIASVQAGDYFVLLHGYTQYSGTTLTGSYSSGSSNQAPVANFSHRANGLSVSFTSTSTDDNGIVSYQWTFGDGRSSTSANPSNTYATDGTYNVTLTVTDQEGLSDSHSATVSVSSGSTGGCSGLSEWNISTSYIPGNVVSYQGTKYTSTWYSTGAQPNVFTQVWTNNGACQ